MPGYFPAMVELNENYKLTLRNMQIYFNKVLEIHKLFEAFIRYLHMQALWGE